MKYTQEWPDFYNEVLNQFMEKHPGVKIARTSTSMTEEGCLTLRIEGTTGVSIVGVLKPTEVEAPKLPDPRKPCGCTKYMGCGQCGKYQRSITLVNPDIPTNLNGF